jgi:hypothetical protein
METNTKEAIKIATRELHKRTGNPVKRLFYQSEHPFAQACGMILWALNSQ